MASFYRTPYAYAVPFDRRHHQIHRWGYRGGRTPRGWQSATEAVEMEENVASPSRSLWPLLVLGLVLVAVAGLLSPLAGAVVLLLLLVVLFWRSRSPRSQTASTTVISSETPDLWFGKGREIEVTVVGVRKPSVITGSGLLDPLEANDWWVQPSPPLPA